MMKNDTTNIIIKNNPSDTNQANAINMIAWEGIKSVNIIGMIIKSARGMINKYIIFSLTSLNTH